MKTVSEVSRLTGISARTLHYYDEIGLFTPSQKSEAGYRLYDDKALETLQLILFFREFDIPLKQIRSVMENPSLDRNQILRMQREMLVAKKDRIERLISSVDDALKGDNRMDFTVFTKTEIEKMFQLMFDSMTEQMRQTAIDEFGGVEKWKQHYIEVVSTQDMQERYAKVMEWYGGKDAYLDTLAHPVSKEVAESFQNREEAIRQKLIAKRGMDMNSFEVKSIIGEYGFVMKQLCQLKEEKGMMLALAKFYREKQCRQTMDQQYGEGAAEFFAQAIETFYQD